MPIDYSKYPKDWKAISARIRARAGNRCETCGVANGLLIIRSDVDAERYVVFCPETGGTMWPNGQWIRASEEPEEFMHADHFTKVVLTVGHLDHNPANNADDNLRCFCQLHHLRHDAKEHAKNAANTRRQKHIDRTGQMEMFNEA